MKIDRVCLALIVGLVVILRTASAEASSYYATLGYFQQNIDSNSEGNGSSRDRVGVEASMLYLSDNYWATKFTAAAYTSGNTRDDSELFTGYASSVFLVSPGVVKIYTGVGVFVGRLRIDERDDNRCDENTLNDRCDIYLTAVYPEAGLIVEAGELLLNVFARAYYDTELGFDSSSFVATGASVGFKFDVR